MTAPTQADEAKEAEGYTVEYAGRLLGLGRYAARRAVARGEIPAIKIGRRIIVPRRAFEEMLKGRERGGDGSA